jgi:uncharacterized protein
VAKMTDLSSLRDQIEGFILFGLFAFLINSIAYAKGFFHLKEKKEATPLPSFSSVILATCIFSGLAYLLSSPLMKALTKLFQNKVEVVAWGTLLLNMFILYGLIWVGLKEEKNFFKLLFKGEKSALFNIGLGILTWFIAFPVVQFAESILNFILTYFFNITTLPDQVALQLLKMVSTKSSLIAILLAIVVVAPIMEELFFRGFIQQWLKRYFNIKNSIFITGLIFAIFHFSISQKWHNLSIIAAIFVFSCFLSFIYEKEKSLLAPIALHSTFNGINALLFLLLNTH